MESDDKEIPYKLKYLNEHNWQTKALIISLYHLLMCNKYPYAWNIQRTSIYFGISIGLVSEDLRIGKELNNGNSNVSEANTREEALKFIERRKSPRK